MFYYREFPNGKLEVNLIVGGWGPAFYESIERAIDVGIIINEISKKRIVLLGLDISNEKSNEGS